MKIAFNMIFKINIYLLNFIDAKKSNFYKISTLKNSLTIERIYLIKIKPLVFF